MEQEARIAQATESPYVTTNMRDFGTRGSNPRDRYPRHDLGFSGASSMLHLFEGTPKATQHIPGYQGHVPRSECVEINSDLRSQAEGTRVRPVKNGWTNLYENYMHNTPHYTGYVPKSVFNDPHGRGGADLDKTSTGTMARQLSYAKRLPESTVLPPFQH
eukprot:gnl/Trimastix_PCT/4448.p1 GENE.gnl/Trimastix_PCT/4448~~gnl/Trimastix_PCT/4448.p1  ORF type:complete len:160 (-),score=8.85 gnl/Trimastix_PCT/4448:202-681(-)